MKNISLFKISAMVITVALASNFVNAQDKVTHAVKTVQPATTQLVKKLNFPTLIEKLDTDKDGALSQAEVTTSHSELLQQIFTKVDTNNDQKIDKVEFNQYLETSKEKAVALVQSAGE